MKMGTYIKELRESMNLSQEELGKMLSPTVNRDAVSKWERGRVENIKRSHIEQLSKIFNVRPSELMCFENTELSEDEKDLLEDYNELNDTGKETARNLVKGLRSTFPKDAPTIAVS